MNGCATWTQIDGGPRALFESQTPSRIRVEAVDGSVAIARELTLVGDTIHGVVADCRRSSAAARRTLCDTAPRLRIALGDVRTVEVRKTNAVLTMLGLAVAAMAVAAAAFAIACSGESGGGGIGSPC